MAKFETGKAYTSSSWKFAYVVIRKTDATLWLYDLVLDKELRRKVRRYNNGGEYVEVDNDDILSADDKYSGDIHSKLDGGKFASLVSFRKGVRIR